MMILKIVNKNGIATNNIDHSVQNFQRIVSIKKSWL